MSWVDLETDLSEMFNDLPRFDRSSDGFRYYRQGRCDGGVSHARRERDKAWLASLPPVQWEVPERIAKVALRLARRRKAA